MTSHKPTYAGLTALLAAELAGAFVGLLDGINALLMTESSGGFEAVLVCVGAGVLSL